MKTGRQLATVARIGALAGIVVALSASAQDRTVRLWPGVAPGSEGWTQKEVQEQSPQMGGEIIRNVVEPTLTVFAPPRSRANGAAIIVCPGGAFQFLSWTNEGTAVAEWLNKLGMTVFVLKYRVTDTGATDAEFQHALGEMFRGLTTDFAGMAVKLAPAEALGAQDGRKAVEVVRQSAAKWGIDPKRIGIMGFSAGASVAMNVTTQHTEMGRPDFTVSIYGPDLQGVAVPKDAPPIFLVCASDDPIVPPTQSAAVYTAWKSGGYSAELHIFNKGGHGFGMKKRGMPVDHWIDLLAYWLKDQGMLKSRQVLE
jgi:acetyl esterase/lipase